MAKSARERRVSEVEEMVSLFEPPHVVGCKGSDPSLVEKVDYPKEPVKDELAEVPWRNNMAYFKLYRFALVMCVHSLRLMRASIYGCVRI